MKKLFPLLTALTVLALSACGGGDAKSSETPAKSSEAPASSEVSSAAPKSSEAPKSSSKAEEHKHAWTKGDDTTNADGKKLINSTCTCGAAKVEIAITDASTGASDIGSDGKLGKAKTFEWKIVAPKAGNATVQFCVAYGQKGDSLTDQVRQTIWGNSGSGVNPYIVKSGSTEGTVLVNEKQYEETGVTADGAYIDFAKVTVVQGENVISLTTPVDQYYRNCFINNVALIIE